MSLSRRFLNLIVDSSTVGVRTLRRIDLTRQQFFNQGPPPPLNGKGSAADTDTDSKASMMEKIRLPRPVVTFRVSAEDERCGIQCFPLADHKVLCADQSGRAFLFDANAHHVVTMPNLHKPKHRPFSIFIPSAGSDNPDYDANTFSYVEDDVGTLYVMEGSPEIEVVDPSLADRPSDQFEAYIYRQSTPTSFKTWQCQPLPPPPYVRDLTWGKLHPGITSYAVVGGGTKILISADGAGTYCMDTVTRTWSQVGRWMIPLYGRIEYVPELNLWFGLSAKNQLSAIDLSDLDSRPRLVGTWKEFDPPEDWEELQDTQLVNLGLGRFCIARFFYGTITDGYYASEISGRTFEVLTGVEVLPRVYEGNGNGSANGCNGNGSASSNHNGGNGSASSDGNGGNCNGKGNCGKVKLRMVKHKSRCHASASGTLIKSVF